MGADSPKQVTKSSRKSFKVKDEIKEFYLHLLDGDAAVKKDFESLTASSRETNGGIFSVSDPQIVEWFPSENNWDVSKGFDSDERYLVVQPVGYGRGKHAGNDSAVVSEFEVVCEGKMKPNAKDPDRGDPQIISNKITITFLGFRTLALAPAGAASASE